MPVQPTTAPPVTPVEDHFTPRMDPIPATPFKPKAPDAGGARQNNVRNHLGPHNNPDMLVCELEDFLASYAPHQNDEGKDINFYFNKMVNRRVIKIMEDGQFRWARYGKRAPSKHGKKENVAFRPLKNIVNIVLAEVEKQGEKQADMQFILVPNTLLKSDIPGSAHKIDACFMAQPLIPQYEKGPILNREINVPLEFKRKRTAQDRAQVHLQILGACHHIMNEDPRRMWIYGMTFENDLCSLWYFSRSHSVKTLVFDWIKDPKLFLRVLLAFAKATPLELGIDPRVHLGPVNTDNALSFVYEVPAPDGGEPRFFQTTQSLSFQRPLAIAGRTTRVWKVVEVTSSSGKKIVDESGKKIVYEDKGKEFILKDVWLDEGSKTEAENMDAIFAAVDKFVDSGVEAILDEDRTATRESLLSPEAVKQTMKRIIDGDPRFKPFDDESKERLCANLTNKTYQSLFLTKLHAWQGEPSKPLGRKVSRCPKLFFPLPLDAIESATSCTTRQPTHIDSLRPMIDDKELEEQRKQERDNAFRRFVPKRQSRVIYEEVCTTLQNVDTLGEVVDILCQTMDAMHILFLAGWVHRDISSNNIMAYRSSPNERWAVKLADLEFSRIMVDPSRKASGDPRTGTPFFMPVEILDRKHLIYRHAILSEEPVAEGAAVSFRSRFQRRPATVADQVNALKLGPEFHATLKHFTVLPFIITIPPDPCWKEVSLQSIPVNHNYQHDLESIWWIILWITLCRIQSEENFIPSQQVLKYFDHDARNSDTRVGLFTQPLNELRPYFHQDLYKPLFDTLEMLRQSMHETYLTRAIFGHLGIAESYTDIQVLFAQVLQATRDMPGPWTKMKLMKRPRAVLGTKSSPPLASQTPGPSNAPGSSNKRPREPSQDESSGESEDDDEEDSDYEDSDSDYEDDAEEEEEARPMQHRDKRSRNN